MLPKIAHGDTSSNVTTAGSVVSFECKPGYTLYGPKTLICQWNGEWNSPPPLCIRKYIIWYNGAN